ncbi:MAG TPA: 6-carboxytetrahydropterin synthase [Bacteroidales bacterium]|jgi:6-pyruvoyltetrahydropterin/6-carboxytetrahydropterin synthase|nr:6-carboxytetrahydropterin synthase [Bacteroidales bacterium]HPE42680.1 6-carboxytetrahydropterin synthase [Bacteroidales bacterium]
MHNIRITKEFKFEMAHALIGYDGPCRNIHGHSYELKVTLIGKPINDTSDPKQGMVIDFGDLKKIVKKQVVDVFDHALVLNKTMNPEAVETLRKHFEKIYVLDYQPTSELMVADFAARIASSLPDKVKVYSVLLRETGTAYAEWYASDNP